jgi:hypothetical protein
LIGPPGRLKDLGRHQLLIICAASVFSPQSDFASAPLGLGRLDL